MRSKVAAVAGAVTGWGGAATLIIIGHTTQAVLAQAFLLAVGAVSAGWLMLSCRNRPLDHVFQLGVDVGWGQGYESGRQDERAELGGGRVIRLQERRRVSV